MINNELTLDQLQAVAGGIPMLPDHPLAVKVRDTTPPTVQKKDGFRRQPDSIIVNHEFE